MLLPKTMFFLLIVNCLLHCICFGLNIESDKFAMTVQQLGKILSKCRLWGTYYSAMVRHSRSDTDWPKEFVGNITVVNLKDSETSEGFPALISRKSPKKIHSLKNFIIITFSLHNYQHLIRKLRKTDLWDPLARYLILDDQNESRGCQDAFAFLNISWVEDLLYSTYFCEDPTDGLTMYTYNPYTRKAPESWKEVNASQYTFKNHVWSLFKQKLIPDRTTCRDFSFDKTITMDGHPLNALVIHHEDGLHVSENGTGFDRLTGYDVTVIKTALAKLNPYLNLTVVLDNPRITWENYTKAVNSGAYDIMLNIRYSYNKANIATTYPYEHSGLSIISQYPEYEKGYVRILTYMNPKVIGAVFLVFAGTALVLCICTGKGITHSTVEAYRILLGTSTVRSPRRNPLRIYLTVVTLLFMLTNAMFQSSLSSLLTIPVRKPYIDTAEDLRNNPDFLLYVDPKQKNIVIDDRLKPQLRISSTADCTEYLKENPRVGCAGDLTHLIVKAVKDPELHVSPARLITMFQTYVVRANWPLRKRLSSILGILTQAGIDKYLRYNKLRHILQKWKLEDQLEMSKSVFRVIELSELMFAFNILVLGFSLATIVFFLEVCAAKLKLRVCRGRT